LAPALTRYLEVVSGFKRSAGGPVYPGSPAIAASILRAGDRIRLFERHPTEHRLLAARFAGSGRRVQVHDGDGLAGLRALLPPPPRRALVLVDPSYERAVEYDEVISVFADAQRRFANGVYAIWYPCIARRAALDFPSRLAAASRAPWLRIGLAVHRPTRDGPGMWGSEMFVLNPPWTLKATMLPVLRQLVACLGTDQGAAYVLVDQESANARPSSPVRRRN